MPIDSEKNKPWRVAIVGGNGENVDLSLLTDRNAIYHFGKLSTIAPGTFDIINEVIPFNKNLIIQGFFFSSTIESEYFIEINGNDFGGGWIALGNPQSPAFNFKDGAIKALAGETIKIIANHNNPVGGEFRAMIWGYDQDITL